MRLYGKRVRNISVGVFDVGILVVLPCHSVESPWFWWPMTAVLWLAFLTIIILELIRLLAPGFTDDWWDFE